MVQKIKHHALVLAGGLGTRLWPLSRRLVPKQFVCKGSDDSLFEQTVTRILPMFPAERIWSIIKPCQTERFAEMDMISTKNTIIEPEPRGTAAAVCLGVAHIAASCPDAVITVMPSDHLIEPAEAFRRTIQDGACWALSHNMIVLYGVRPERPETSYGYVETGSVEGNVKGRTFKNVLTFHEKPNKNIALQYASSETFLWNSGIFTFSFRTFMELAALFSPWMHEGVHALIKGIADGKDTEHDIYAAFDDISIDRALIEKIKRDKDPGIAVTSCDFAWHDMGIWETYFFTSETDSSGNILSGDNVAIDCSDTMLLSDRDDLLIGAIGLDGMVVVAVDNAALICPRERLGEVGKIVKELEKKGMKEHI